MPRLTYSGAISHCLSPLWWRIPAAALLRAEIFLKTFSFKKMESQTLSKTESSLWKCDDSSTSLITTQNSKSNKSDVLQIYLTLRMTRNRLCLHKFIWYIFCMYVYHICTYAEFYSDCKFTPLQVIAKSILTEWKTSWLLKVDQLNGLAVYSMAFTHFHFFPSLNGFYPTF